MRRTFIGFSASVLLAASLVGCAQKSDEFAISETSTDSLLSTNPVEQPQGDLTPQEQYQPDQTQNRTPPTPAPRTPTPRRPAPSQPSSPPAVQAPSGVTLAAGTPVEVAVNTQISTETAQVGETWTGQVKENVIVGSTVVIPAGSIVSGVVNVAKPAEKGSRAMLGLAVRSVSVNGRDHTVAASTPAIEAGSTRARNLGAVAGGAAAGALIGKAAGGGGKGALIGGLIGGAAAGAGVAASKGFQVVLKEGTVITFSVDENVLVKS